MTNMVYVGAPCHALESQMRGKDISGLRTRRSHLKLFLLYGEIIELIKTIVNTLFKMIYLD
jgi:hypothetical protein